MREISDAAMRNYLTSMLVLVRQKEVKNILLNFPRHERKNFPFSSVIFYKLNKKYIVDCKGGWWCIFWSLESNLNYTIVEQWQELLDVFPVH